MIVATVVSTGGSATAAPHDTQDAKIVGRIVDQSGQAVTSAVIAVELPSGEMPPVPALAGRVEVLVRDAPAVTLKATAPGHVSRTLAVRVSRPVTDIGQITLPRLKMIALQDWQLLRSDDGRSRLDLVLVNEGQDRTMVTALQVEGKQQEQTGCLDLLTPDLTSKVSIEAAGDAFHIRVTAGEKKDLFDGGPVRVITRPCHADELDIALPLKLGLGAGELDVAIHVADLTRSFQSDP